MSNRAALALTLMLACQRADAQSGRQKFLADYAPHAAKLESLFANVSYNIESVVYDYVNGDMVQRSAASCKSNSRNFLMDGEYLEVRRGPDNKWYKIAPETYGENPQYLFQIRSNQKAGKQVLEKLEVAPIQLSSAPANAPFAHRQYPAKTYLDIVNDPTTEVVDYFDTNWEGRPAKRLTLRMQMPDLTTALPYAQKLREREFYFDPLTSWVCVGMGFANSGTDTVPEAIRADFVYTYVTGDDSKPKLESIVSFVTLKNSTARRAKHTEMKLSHFVRHDRPFDAHEFTLSAQGFPEPEGLLAPVVPPQTPWTLWLALSAAVGIVLFGVFVVRRRNTSPPVTP